MVLLWLVTALFWEAGTGQRADSAPPPFSALLRRATAEPAGDAILVRADGTGVSSSRFWAWLERSGIGRADLARASLSSAELTQVVCAFADAVDWADRGLSDGLVDETERQTLWQAALADAAFQKVTAGPTTGPEGPDGRRERVAALQLEAGEANALPAILARRAIELGLATDPGVLQAFHWALADAAEARARRRDETLLAARLEADLDVSNAETELDSDRPQCIENQVLPDARVARAAHLLAPYLARAAALRLRSRSTITIVSMPSIPAP